MPASEDVARQLSKSRFVRAVRAGFSGQPGDWRVFKSRFVRSVKAGLSDQPGDWQVFKARLVWSVGLGFQSETVRPEGSCLAGQ